MLRSDVQAEAAQDERDELGVHARGPRVKLAAQYEWDELGLPFSQSLDEESSEAMADAEIRISIDGLQEKLNQLINPISEAEYRSILQMPPQNYIFKVPRPLREVNPGAYEPQTISIGPYHHGKEHLKPMELHKRYCLNSILERNNQSLAEYVEAMTKIEAKARRFYADTVKLEPKEFAEMMLLDGCFIVELIRLVQENSGNQINNPDHGSEYLFKVKLYLPYLAYDLLLLENQLPLFVVQDLFKMSSGMENERDSFDRKAISFFCRSGAQTGDSSGVKHLLGLVYQHCFHSQGRFPTIEFQPKLGTLRHAIALQQAGITFKPKKFDQQNRNEEISSLDIEFKNGIMEIPTLRVDDYTERILRNFMAYEQFRNGPKLVCDYAVFMDCLINTDKDAELLHRDGIIDNWLGDHEVVANMFNKLCQHVKISMKNYYYQQIHVDVNKHCRQRRHEWMAILRHDYFNTPWAFISFLGALILLVATTGQFIVSLI